MQIKQIATGGNYFKAEDHKDDAAILIEPKDFRRQVPNNFGPRDEVVADVTYFKKDSDIEKGNGERVEGVTFGNKYLTAPLENLVGEITVVKLGQSKPKAGQRPAWIWNQVEADVLTKIGEFVEEREAQLAKDAEEGPDF